MKSTAECLASAIPQILMGHVKTVANHDCRIETISSDELVSACPSIAAKCPNLQGEVILLSWAPSYISGQGVAIVWKASDVKDAYSVYYVNSDEYDDEVLQYYGTKDEVAHQVIHDATYTG